MWRITTHKKPLLLQKVYLKLNWIAFWGCVLGDEEVVIFSISEDESIYPLTYVCILIVFNLLEVLRTKCSCFTVSKPNKVWYLLQVSFGCNSELDLWYELSLAGRCFLSCQRVTQIGITVQTDIHFSFLALHMLNSMAQSAKNPLQLKV